MDSDTHAQPERLEQGISPWLDALASDSAAPGGGAVAALAAAAAAALVAMSCRATIGRPAYAESQPLVSDALEQAERLRASAFTAMHDDGEAYRRVMAAAKLPRESDEDRSRRRAALDEALIGAAEVPLQVAHIAAEVLALAQRIHDSVNRNALGDLDAAIDTADAAIATSVRNARINLDLVKDHSAKSPLLTTLAEHGAAEQVT